MIEYTRPLEYSRVLYSAPMIVLQAFVTESLNKAWPVKGGNGCMS
jgi:hypothetical protein